MTHFEDAKKARTAAKTKLTTSANAVHHAIRLGMTSLPDYVKTLDLNMINFLDRCRLFRAHADYEKVEESLTVVNGLGMDEYEAKGDETFQEAHLAYVAHVEMQNASRQPLPLSPPPLGNPSGAPKAYFKKRDFPVFLGKRKDWPEFKVQWKLLVEPEFPNPLQLATELKRACKGDALNEIDNIPAGSVDSYKLMWDKLCAHYDNVTLSVFSALNELKGLKAVKEDSDFSGFLTLVKGINSVYQQLETLQHLSKVTAREVTEMAYLLPPLTQRQWFITFAAMNPTSRLEPFVEFHKFLLEQEKCAKLMADTYVAVQEKDSNMRTAKSSARSVSSHHISAPACPLHPSNAVHNLASCGTFVSEFNLSAKWAYIRAIKHCKVCLLPSDGQHDFNVCGGRCETCNAFHHPLLCSKRESDDNGPRRGQSGHSSGGGQGGGRRNSDQSSKSNSSYSSGRASNASNSGGSGQSKGSSTSSFSGKKANAGNHQVDTQEDSAENPTNVGANMVVKTSPKQNGKAESDTHPRGLYSIFAARTANGQVANVFSDDGSDVSFVSHEGLKKLEARKLRDAWINMSTLNATEKLRSALYEVTFITRSGRKEAVQLYSIPSLSGPIKQLDEKVLAQVFPNHDPTTLRRPTGSIDILLGADYWGIHPQQIVASDGAHLSIMQGELGVCVKGSHHLLSDVIDSSKIAGYHIEIEPPMEEQEEPLKVKEHPEFSMPSQGKRKRRSNKKSTPVEDCAPRTITSMEVSIPRELGMNKTEVGLHSVATPLGRPELVNKPVQQTLQFQPSILVTRQAKRNEPPLSDLGSKQRADQIVAHEKKNLEVKMRQQNKGKSNRGQKHITNCRRSIILAERELAVKRRRRQVKGAAQEKKKKSGSSKAAKTPSALKWLKGGLFGHGKRSGSKRSTGTTNVKSRLLRVKTCGDLRTIGSHTSSAECTQVSQRVNESNPVRSCTVKVDDVNTFIRGEQLGTEVNPKCGSCACRKCPIAGHSYSFKEEQELRMIQERLHYDSKKEKWIAKYPWVVDPMLLPDNYGAAIATLRSTERKLASDPSWAATYNQQILEHRDRGVARKLTDEEIAKWKGAVFYLATMALEQPKSLTTPVRLVFNSSQLFRGVSLNSCLAKGPDAYNNDLLGMLLRFRENRVVMIGDIKKMYNSVLLSLEDQHTHRFLWRNCEDRKPDVWCITRVNLGDRPAGTIAIVAKDNTARMFAHINPEAADVIIYCTYTDDVINSVKTFGHAQGLARDIETILNKGGFSIKGWTFGGHGVPREELNQEKQEVLGASYEASSDSLFFPARINFSPKKRNVFTEPNLTAEDIPAKVPTSLTRRLVLQQVMAVYDPLGLLAPFLLEAKLLLRQTWELKLDWDTSLPQSMWGCWLQFFSKLFAASNIQFPRCLTPEQATVGNPELIILSDGSELAYGAAAYIRWRLASGSYWTRLIMAKCRIAPINRVSIPQMELNGAVLAKRLRKVVEKEMRIEFSKTTHLIDSRTVLYQINKISTRFNVYEGVRIGEIQAATNGDVSCWGWIPTASNIADWVTKPRDPCHLIPGSHWWNGPSFLAKDESEWNVVFSPTVKEEEYLPGEKKIKVHASQAREEVQESITANTYRRCSKMSKIIGAWAVVLEIVKKKSFKEADAVLTNPQKYKEAEMFLIQDAQKALGTAKDVARRFKTVHPLKKDGTWVVGLRFAEINPMTPENEPQIVLPPFHPLTKLYMTDFHVNGRHAGRDATVAAFRSRFYTSHANNLSRGVTQRCYRCKILKGKLMTQMMGQLPPDRLKPAPPFNTTMLDLFGPFNVRGEVQKRITAKIYGVLFVDLVCRAAHIEVLCGYDTKSFLLALRRFAAIRGWPSKIYSDPGSQLKGASEDLLQAFRNISQRQLQVFGAPKGLQWVFGPADSPWYQGAAEALIKSTKNALKLSMGSSRLSVPEALTVFTEAANLLNERPIGTLPSPESPVNVLTPNMLLLGRSMAINPGNFEAHTTINSRVSLVQGVVDQFWRQWTATYAPTLVQQSKWLAATRGVKKDDIVLVADSNVLRGEYRIAQVKEAVPDSDGLVRRATIRYKNFKAGEALRVYTGAPDQVVERSIQRLSLLVPVEVQSTAAPK